MARDRQPVEGIQQIPANTILGNNTVSPATILALSIGEVAAMLNAYAEIYVADASAAQAIDNGTTYTKCTLFTANGAASNCTADAANDKITLTRAGKYAISGTFSMKSGTNNVDFKGSLFYDGVEQSNIHWERKISTAGDIGNASFSGILDAAANKDIDVRIRHGDAGSVNFTLTYANLSVRYLGA